MRKKELESIYYLSLELKRSEEIIKDLQRSKASTEIIGAYTELLQAQSDEILRRKIAAEQYINDIKDDHIRLIAKMRYIDLKSWEQIGAALHYDRSVVYRHFKAYFK